MLLSICRGVITPVLSGWSGTFSGKVAFLGGGSRRVEERVNHHQDAAPGPPPGSGPSTLQHCFPHYANIRFGALFVEKPMPEEFNASNPVHCFVFALLLFAKGESTPARLL